MQCTHLILSYYRYELWLLASSQCHLSQCTSRCICDDITMADGCKQAMTTSNVHVNRNIQWTYFTSLNTILSPLCVSDVIWSMSFKSILWNMKIIAEETLQIPCHYSVNFPWIATVHLQSGIAQLKKCMCPRGMPPKFLCAFMRFYVPF